SVSNVDVVCTDKTGTLTTGQLTLKEVEPGDGGTVAAAEAVLGGFAHRISTPNLTTAALAAALPGDTWSVLDEVPFTSSLRWSGLVTDSPDVHGTWVLGAPDVLAFQFTRPLPDDALTARTSVGLRVLVLARGSGISAGLHDAEGRPELPDLEPVAIVALADELRPEVADTIARFRENGVSVKVLSGDDPRTVAALAAQAGLDPGEPVP